MPPNPTTPLLRSLFLIWNKKPRNLEPHRERSRSWKPTTHKKLFRKAQCGQAWVTDHKCHSRFSPAWLQKNANGNSVSKGKNIATRGWSMTPSAMGFQDFWKGFFYPNKDLSFSTSKFQLQLAMRDSKIPKLIKTSLFHIEVTSFHGVQRVANPAVSRLDCSARQVLFSF